MKAVLVINPQNDFVNYYGYEGEVIAENIAAKVRELAANDTNLYVIQETHSYFPESRSRVPYPMIETFGWEVNPVIAEAVFDTRRQYADTFNQMKSDIAAAETVDYIKDCNNFVLMGFEAADLAATAKLIKVKFPEAKIKIECCPDPERI